MSNTLIYRYLLLLPVFMIPATAWAQGGPPAGNRLGRVAVSPLRQETGSIRSPLYQGDASSARPNVGSQLSSPAQTGSPIPQRPGATGTQNQSPSQITSDGTIEIDHGVVAFIDDITLPALEPGAIKSIVVEEGQFIPAGTVVGRIDDSLLLKEYELAKLRYENARELALSDVPVRAASAEHALRYSQLQKKAELYRKNSVSASDYEQAKFEADIAELKIENAKLDRITSRGEAQLELVRLETAKHRLARHELKSEYNAYVVEIQAKPQEYVNVGDPVMRLGRMDQLWVQGNIRSDRLEVHQALHRPVTVVLNMPGDRKETFRGRVDQIGVEMQGSDNFQIKVRVENRQVGNAWLLRPLGQVKILVHLDQEVVAGK